MADAQVKQLDPIDLFDVRSALTEEERMVQDSVARLVDEKVLPIIQSCFEEHRFPRELVPELADPKDLFGELRPACTPPVRQAPHPVRSLTAA